MLLLIVFFFRLFLVLTDFTPTHSFTDSCVVLDPITITWTLATNTCVFWTSICMCTTGGGGVLWPLGCLTCAICYLQSQITRLQASFPACLLTTALPKIPPSPHTLLSTGWSAHHHKSVTVKVSHGL